MASSKLGNYKKMNDTKLSAVRFINENRQNEDMKLNSDCSCEYCFKKFENVSQLFRHISHAKMCSENYGKVYIDAMRKELRNQSKRKWFEANKESLTTSPKNTYIPNSVRLTDHGRKFLDVFRKVFRKHQSVAQAHIEEYSADLSNFVTDEDLNKALDLAFSDIFILHLDCVKVSDDEEENLNVFFSHIEKTFRLKLMIGNGSYYWKKEKENVVGIELWRYASNQAFLKFYDETQFKNMLDCATDLALDEIFLKLITTDQYFEEDISNKELEMKLESIFHELVRDEVEKRSEEIDIIPKLDQLMEEIMKKRVYINELEHLCPKF